MSDQVGGDHYDIMEISPIEFIHKNDLNFCQGNIVKYICRYKNKDGILDLRKIIQYTELLIKLEYGGEE